MKFACKIIHGGPVHHCYEPVEALQQCMVLSEVWKAGLTPEGEGEKKKDNPYKLNKPMASPLA